MCEVVVVQEAVCGTAQGEQPRPADPASAKRKNWDGGGLSASQRVLHSHYENRAGPYAGAGMLKETTQISRVESWPFCASFKSIGLPSQEHAWKKHSGNVP